jgi:hypothetical protein
LRVYPESMKVMSELRQREEDEAMHIEDMQRLVTEIEMLKVVLCLVRRRGGREKSDAPTFALFKSCE